jgi:oxalate decarboxylase/phosphoglucose isomerase-like protein (cupin superfamily)
VADEIFIAESGTAIYHAPNLPHRMVNKGTQPLRAAWFWWAPGGRTDYASIRSHTVGAVAVSAIKQATASAAAMENAALNGPITSQRFMTSAART